MSLVPQWIQDFNAECDQGVSGFAARLMQQVYRHFSRSLFPKISPLLQAASKPRKSKWGGQGVFFDVVLSKHAPRGSLYVLPNQATIVVPDMPVKAHYLNLPVIQNPNHGMITGITL